MPDHTVLVLVDDLFFLSKIQTTLRHIGMSAQVLTSPQALGDYLRTATPALAVIDLTLRVAAAVDLIGIIRAEPLARDVPILAFGPHVAADAQRQARQAGATQVVAKSEFSRHLPDLIRRYVRQQ
jgi:two-component system cell cycle response regulator DivK